MKTNTRRQVKMNFFRKPDCVIGGVSPDTGKSIFLQTDKVNSQSVSTFIQDLSQAYPEYKNILILDNASFHISQRSPAFPLPDNVELMFLPTYSPDLNPIERLWKYFKDEWINNRFFENIYHLRNTVNDALYNLLNEPNVIKSICQAC